MTTTRTTKHISNSVRQRARLSARRSQRDDFTRLLLLIMDLGIPAVSVGAVLGVSTKMGLAMAAGYAPVPVARRPRLFALAVLTLNGAMDALRDLRDEVGEDTLAEFELKTRRLKHALKRYPEWLAAAKRDAARMQATLRRGTRC